MLSPQPARPMSHIFLLPAILRPVLLWWWMRKAARSIDCFLHGKPVVPQPNALLNKHIPGTIFESVEGIVSKKRTEMPELPVAQRIHNLNEVDLVISEEDAKYESNRCLSCCRLCYNADS